MSTILFVLFWVLLGLAIVLAAMRSGRRGPLFDPASRGGRRGVAWLTALNEKAGAIQLTASERAGRESFNRACGQCHTLSASNSVGRVGPDLDQLRPPKELVLDAIDKGRARGMGQMPSQVVEGQEAENVAAFVAKTAGR
jgi:mono/diheme cytochrome c family protein